MGIRGSEWPKSGKDEVKKLCAIERYFVGVVIMNTQLNTFKVNSESTINHTI